MTDELKELYSNYADERRYYECITLYHPKFQLQDTSNFPALDRYPNLYQYPGYTAESSNSHFLIRNEEDKSLMYDNKLTVFLAYPFDISLPESGSDQQDLKIAFDNVSVELINGLEQAIQQPQTPIKCTYSVYIEGSNEPQITPIVLSLQNIQIDVKAVTCTASRPDLYNRRFPYGSTSQYDQRFKGLWL